MIQKVDIYYYDDGLNDVEETVAKSVGVEPTDDEVEEFIKNGENVFIHHYDPILNGYEL